MSAASVLVLLSVCLPVCCQDTGKKSAEQPVTLQRIIDRLRLNESRIKTARGNVWVTWPGVSEGKPAEVRHGLWMMEGECERLEEHGKTQDVYAYDGKAWRSFHPATNTGEFARTRNLMPYVTPSHFGLRVFGVPFGELLEKGTVRLADKKEERAGREWLLVEGVVRDPCASRHASKEVEIRIWARAREPFLPVAMSLRPKGECSCGSSSYDDIEWKQVADGAWFPVRGRGRVGVGMTSEIAVTCVEVNGELPPGCFRYPGWNERTQVKNGDTWPMKTISPELPPWPDSALRVPPAR